MGKIPFFEETFLLGDTSMDVLLEMLFLSLRHANVQFDTENLTWRTDSTAETLSTTRRVELINKHKFARGL